MGRDGIYTAEWRGPLGVHRQRHPKRQVCVILMLAVHLLCRCSVEKPATTEE
jgi:hypothetical protein